MYICNLESVTDILNIKVQLDVSHIVSILNHGRLDDYSFHCAFWDIACKPHQGPVRLIVIEFLLPRISM